MPHTILRLLLALAAVATLSFSAQAEDDFDRMYREYTNLYNTSDNDKDFYAHSSWLRQYYKDHNDRKAYFKIEMNEAMYESDHHRPNEAIRKSVNILNQMKEESFNGRNLVYLSLGAIFESYGNENVARHYFEEAIANTNDHDDRTSMDAYSRMAGLLKLSHPDEARQWNEKYAFLSEKFPPYHQVYLFINAVIAFAEGDKAAFLTARDAYHEYRSQHPELDNYGVLSVSVMDHAFSGRYDEARQQLDSIEADMGPVARHDMRILIYQMQGKLADALQASRQRALCVDSLNSTMQLHNISQMSAETALAKARSDAAKERIRLFTVVLLLAGALIVLLVVYNYLRQKDRQRLKERNEQLKSALTMAEESDKMKTEFVRSVSHEIRTPLNAISGFTDVVTTPDIELSEEDRRDLINRINTNVEAIIHIVDDMLHMSEQSSSAFYPRSGSVLCNQFLSQLLYSYRNKVSAKVKLNYTTGVINRFSLQTNQQGLEQIVAHLIDNAVKFTAEGSIELNCRMSDDNQHVVISVTDTGKGISQEQQDLIFKKFYKVDTFEQGMGLGLSVSKKIAQKMGGDLILDKQYTSGARFVLTLPV